ncbi:hypothetical protein GCM10010420_24450 [Streptomyces glaucosporus]|uniref:Secreted protein n=2 Tax=Streptomyces glaucosporus TaxID=284044 RepID=A0ABN3I9L8_9ACTN
MWTAFAAGVVLLAPATPPYGPVDASVPGPHLRSEPLDDRCLRSWVLPADAPRAPEVVPPFEDDRLHQSWLRHTGAAFPGKAETVITLTGDSRRTVRLLSVEVTVTGRSAPLDGPVVSPGDCPASPPPLAPVIAVDLDDLPLGRAVSAAPHAGVDLPRDVAPGESLTLRLSGSTRRHVCDWTATLRWWDGTGTRKRTIDHRGRPFRVTAPVAETGEAAR